MRVLPLIGIGLIVATLAIVAVPLCIIWSLNTLFGLAIAYTSKTWLATLLLSFVISGWANPKLRKE